MWTILPHCAVVAALMFDVTSAYHSKIYHSNKKVHLTNTCSIPSHTDEYNYQHVEDLYNKAVKNGCVGATCNAGASASDRMITIHIQGHASTQKPEHMKDLIRIARGVLRNAHQPGEKKITCKEGKIPIERTVPDFRMPQQFDIERKFNDGRANAYINIKIENNHEDSTCQVLTSLLSAAAAPFEGGGALGAVSLGCN